MKQLLALSLSLFMLNKTLAQNRADRAFKLDMASGIVFPTGKTFLESRILIAVEPKYHFADPYSLGLRLELAPNTVYGGTFNPLIVRSVLSFLLTGDYFFNSGTIQPFLGVGAGIFKQDLSNAGSPTIRTKEKQFGIMTRAGLERKHFRLGVEYNAAFNEKSNKLHYISLKAGAFVWGKRKKGVAEGNTSFR